jgi:type 2 lantibiotic biosynthesis protein LanM
MRMIDDRVAADMAGRGSTLAERLGGGHVARQRGGGADRIPMRLDRWRHLAAGGDEDRFLRRLRWSGIDPEAVLPLLGEVELRSGAEPARWVEDLDRILAAAADCGGERQLAEILHSGDPLPFEDVLAPIAEAAHTELRSRCADLEDLLASGAVAALVRQLLSDLSSIAARTLQVEFSSFRRQRRSTFDTLLSNPSQLGGRRVYDGFVDRLADGGLVELFERYPVLARLVTSSVVNWTDASEDLVRHFASDAEAIESFFGSGDPLGRVVAVMPRLSDPHNRGRSVAAVTFASGLRLAYKPRPVAADRGFGMIAQWFAERGAPLVPAAAKVLDRSDHGWVEWIDHRSCGSRLQVGGYYRNAGALLAFAYVFSVHDLHHENLVAAGDRPVPVDVETMLQGEVDGPGAGRSVGSVLNTGLLPHPMPEQGLEPTADLSGLGATSPRSVGVELPVWRHVNTDAMTMGFEPGVAPLRENAPILDGRAASPGAYAAEVEEGFREAYGHILGHRREIVASGGPLTSGSDLPVRFLFRPSQLYASLLQRTLHPDCLRDGADRSIELDVLCRPLLRSDDRPATWGLVAAEIEALERMDFPHFLVRGGDRLVRTVDGSEVRCLARSGSEMVADRLSALGERDLEHQLTAIRASLDR